MTKQTRVGIFETNSSSAHSISIGEVCAEDMMDKIIPDGEGIICLSGGDFGWGPEKYYDALTKAEYLAVWVRQYSGSKEKDRRMLDKVLKDQTGAKKIEWGFTTDWDSERLSNRAYIDHQSDDVAREFFRYEMKQDGCDPKTLMPIMEKTGITRVQAAERIRQFIFNRGSILKIDNDNH